MEPAAKAELLQLLTDWSNADEPLVEAIGDTLAHWQASTRRNWLDVSSAP